jgi:High-affinity nickel-transport protein
VAPSGFGRRRGRLPRRSPHANKEDSRDRDDPPGLREVLGQGGRRSRRDRSGDGSAGAAGLPWYAILCLPVLFAAGMSLMDSIDGSFMNFAYGWAFSKPVRKVFYNLTVTGRSVWRFGRIEERWSAHLE